MLANSVSGLYAVKAQRFQLMSPAEPDRPLADKALPSASRSGCEARFRGIFENAAIGIALVGTDGRFLEVNEHLCSIFGYPRKDLMEMTFQEITYPEDLNKDLEQFNLLLRDRISTYTMEKRYIHRMGHVVWALLTVAIQRREGGEPDYAISLVRDISREKRLASMLELEHRRYKLVSEATHVGIFDCDHVGGGIYFSPVCKHQLGFADRELPGTGMAFFRRIHRDDRKAFAMRVRTYLKRRGVLDTEVRLIGRYGEVHWIRYRMAALLDERGRLQRSIGTQLDVTEDKKRELELVESKMVAEAASEAKSRFLANMSHELRTPLNPILALSELLIQGTESPEDVAEFALLIHQAGGHMLELVNQVLDLARIQAGRTRMEPEWFQLPGPFAATVQLMRQQAMVKNLNLEADFSGAHNVEIHACSQALRQIAFNLISNAIKFTDEGTVEVRLRLQQRTGGTDLLLSVIDSGPGIAEADQKRIFDAFERVDDSLSSRQQGFGLGLSISSRLAEALGGAIEVRSQMGQGSTFTLRIPVTSRWPDSEDSHLEKPQGATASGKAASHSGCRVLIVEDEPSNQTVARLMLERFGYEVIIANDGYEAIELVGSAEFDWILMDLKMPGLDGLETTRRIKPMLRNPLRCRIVALTANVTTDAREACERLGMHGFVTKPIRFDQLRRLLEA